MNLIDVIHACSGYDNRAILHDVSFGLCPGDLIGLAGPNGSGKTTLLHCLTGYHGLSDGAIHLRGKNISGLSRRVIAGEIAFMPQQTESVYSYSVLEMVIMGRHPYAGLSAVDTPHDIHLAQAALDRLDIGHLCNRDFGRLSGGEKQLVLLARAFVQEAPILLLDEPLTGLDIRHQYQLMNAIQSTAGEPGHAAIATFHDLAVAARWCTKLILLRGGRIIASGPPEAVITPKNLAALYDVTATVSVDALGQFAIHVTGYPSPDGS